MHLPTKQENAISDHVRSKHHGPGKHRPWQSFERIVPLDLYSDSDHHNYDDCE